MMWRIRSFGRSAGVRLVLILWAAFALCACIITDTATTTNEFHQTGEPPTILLLDPDVEISFIQASEVRQVRADWTQNTKETLIAELQGQLAPKDIRLIPFAMADITPRQQQVLKLSEIVGYTILTYHYGTKELPSKNDRFDWSLGPGAQLLSTDSDADYALLLYARGEYASAGKQMTNAAGVVLGAYVGITLMGSIGEQRAFVSLIDLRTGDIVWFNVASTGAGTDMREQSGAKHLVRNLLRTAPF